MILELTRLSECYVYRFYYETLTRHGFLKVKRDSHCLWSYSINIDDDTSYYRLTNFDHSIIKSNSDYIELIFQKLNLKKEGEEVVLMKRKYKIRE